MRSTVTTRLTAVAGLLLFAATLAAEAQSAAVLRAGLVRSLAQPGGNVTGQSFMGPEMAVKEFDLLAEAFPRAKRIAALFDPALARTPAREPTWASVPLAPRRRREA